MKLAATVSLALLFASPILAQDPAAHPSPAPELARLQRLAGSWTGKGTVCMTPGQQPIAWTCQSNYAWTLGKHFLAADTLIDFGGAMPQLAFRELLGWDGEGKRFVAISVGNECSGSLAEITFPNDDTMVQVIAKKADGKPVAERHTTTFTKDGMNFLMTMVPCEGAPFDCVTGSFTRAAETKAVAAEAAAAMAPLAEPVAKMNRCAGTYDVAGELIMMPGMPVMKITGRDVCTPIFGGAVLQTITTGKSDMSPEPYEGLSFVVWNAGKQCFDLFGADNMGWVGTMEQRFLGDNQLVATSMACYMGQPMAMRMLADLDAAGKITKQASWALCGAAEPYCSFKGDYKLVK